MDRVIDSGAGEGVFRWSLRVGGDDDHYGTMLRNEDDRGVVDDGGMWGPKLWGSDLLNVSSGGNRDRGPRGVSVRCDPRICRLLLSFEDGRIVDITAADGEVIDGLRFGVALVGSDERLKEVVGVDSAGAVLERFEMSFHDSQWHRDR